MKCKGDRKSAFELIQVLVKENTQITLALQEQMANENKSLDETDAGKVLHAAVIKERKKFEKSLAEVKEQMLEAVEAKDKESARALQGMQDDYRDQIKRLERAGKTLKEDLEEMHMSKYRQLEARLLDAERRHEKEFRLMDRNLARQKQNMPGLREEAIYSRDLRDPNVSHYESSTQTFLGFDPEE